MTVIRFNIPLDDDLNEDEAKALAASLQAEFRKEAALEQAETASLGEGRSAASVAAAVAVALPLIMDGVKTIDALIGVFEKIKKLKSGPKKTAEVFANIKPEKILIDVDGVLVPLPKLTEEHLKNL